MEVDMKEVARRAGVSIATVSRVLGNKPYVREEVRQRVLEAVAALDYRPSRLAQRLRSQGAGVLGLIISDIQNPFFTSLVRAVEDAAQQRSFGVFLCNSDEDPEKEEFYIELLKGERVSGIVITPTQERGDALAELAKTGIPLVCVDRRYVRSAIDTVVLDNVGAAGEIVSHLIEDGHKRIGGIFGPQETTTGRERKEGYLRALKQHDIPIRPELIREGLPKEEAGIRFTREMLDMDEPPTALLGGNNLLTLGAVRVIRERGLVVPDDIAIVSFDEMDWMSIAVPPLTVVAQPTYELGSRAADLLFQRIENPDLPAREVVLKPAIYIRQSCAAHR